MVESQQKKIYTIKNDKIALFPYLKEFVPKYNQWMQNEELLYLTASEKLTLQEELDNQESWLLDKEKYTFLIFYKHEQTDFLDPQIKEVKNSNVQSMIKGYEMIGDVNIFFHPWLEENECEIDIMIAETAFRGKGIAKQVVQLMINFGHHFYNKKIFIAKIKNDNKASINLFKKLDFIDKNQKNAFDEVQLDFQVDPDEQDEEKIKFHKQTEIQEINLKDYL